MWQGRPLTARSHIELEPLQRQGGLQRRVRAGPCAAHIDGFQEYLDVTRRRVLVLERGAQTDGFEGFLRANRS